MFFVFPLPVSLLFTDLQEYTISIWRRCIETNVSNCIVLLMTLHYGNVTLLTFVIMQQCHIEMVYS